MLRNLGILKIMFCRPMRSDQYKTGPGEVSRTTNASTKQGTNNKTIAAITRIRSNTRFKAFPPKKETLPFENS
jgi:hypothetical protein